MAWKLKLEAGNVPLTKRSLLHPINGLPSCFVRDILYSPRRTRYGRHMESLVEISDQLDLRCRCSQLLGPFVRPCQKRRLHEEVIQGA